jgi:hypothetical protein
MPWGLRISVCRLQLLITCMGMHYLPIGQHSEGSSDILFSQISMCFRTCVWHTCEIAPLPGQSHYYFLIVLQNTVRAISFTMRFTDGIFCLFFEYRWSLIHIGGVYALKGRSRFVSHVGFIV